MPLDQNAKDQATVPDRDVFVLPASFGQERYWGLDRLSPGNPTWSVPVRFRLQGELNPVLLERAFNEIVARHEVLRTTFVLKNGQLSQVIHPELRISVPVADLRHFAKTERDAEADRLSFKEARTGFDLARGPLFRVSLLRVDDSEHILLVTPHHSVADYWSIGLISNELGSLYEAYSRGMAPVLPELPIQYADYTIWQREQSDTAEVKQELGFWRERLKDIPLLDFPTDRPRGPVPTYEATITSILLPIALTDSLKAIGNRYGATFFNTLLAALAIVMQRYSGQCDFGVATQVAGRNSIEVERLIGAFINTVVLRLNLDGNPRFSELLQHVQSVSTDSLANQNVRFEQVLKELRPEAYPSHHTLFRLNFICQRDPVKPLEFAGIKLTVIPSKSQGALYDLNVFLVLRNEGWRLACEYNTDLFDANTITTLLSNYRSLLEQVADNPDAPISQFPLPVDPFKGKSAQPSASVEGRAECTTDPKMAESVAFAGPGSKSATSSEINNFPANTAESYVMPASSAQRRFWALEQMWPGSPALHMRACVRVQGRFSLQNLAQSLEKIVQRHEILRTTFENVSSDLVQVIAPKGELSLKSSSLEKVSEADRESHLWAKIYEETKAPFDLARGPLMRVHVFQLRPLEHVVVITTHHIVVDGWSQNVIQAELWSSYEKLSMGLEPDLPPLPIQYADFSHWQLEWLRSEEAQNDLEFWKRQLAPPVPVLELPTDHTFRRHQATDGAMETLLLDEDLVKELKTLAQEQQVTMFMLMLSCFAALLCRYAEQHEIVVGSPVANRKPETEGLIGPFAGPIFLRLKADKDLTIRNLLTHVRETSLDALAHTELPFEVVTEQLRVPSVHGRNPLSQFYFFYQAAFLRPRKVNDLTVTPMRDFALGTHFELQLGLLERAEGLRAQLEYNPALFESSTVHRMLKDYQTLLRFILQNPDATLAELPIPAMPKEQTPSSEVSVPGADASPHDETEKRIAEIWEQVLGVRSVGRKQNYFELGGTSLLAVTLFSRLEKTFNMRLPLAILFEAQTVQELARVIRTKRSESNWSPLVGIQTHGSRPPFFCVHGGGGNVLIYRELARQLGPDQPFYGLQCQGLDGRQPLLTSIEDMAALYVRVLKQVQPRGPYYLGGYCLGGTIALEMAQQLRKQGETVALLALFDTLDWSKMEHKPFFPVQAYHEAQRMWFHIGNFFLLDFKNMSKFFREKMRELSSRSHVWLGMFLERFTKERTIQNSESLLLAKIWETNDLAAVAYAPRPYAGRIADFRPMKQYSKYQKPGADWQGIAVGEHEIVVLEVFPAGMLLHPFVRDLATQLRAAIDRAMSSNAVQRQEAPVGNPIELISVG